MSVRTRLAGLLVALIAALAMPPVTSAAATTYYVDCSAGSDSNSGTSTGAAWRSLSRPNSVSLAPGDTLRLKRGCTWTGPLNARWIGTSTSPITITSYGSGDLPRIQNGHENLMITGDHQVIEQIWTRSDVPARDSGCESQPMGWRVGFRFMSGAAYNTVRYSRAEEQYHGVLVEPGAHHNRILNNTLRNNNMKDPDPMSDAGAVGVTLMGDDNEVAHNVISGSDTCSRQHGRDGAAVEVYGGSRNRIHHNTAAQNHNFTELGKTPSADNVYAYNRVTSTLTRANFVVTRGSSDSYGPVYRTRMYNNTVHLSGSSSYAIQCYGGCGTGILTFKGNIVVAQDRVGYADHGFDESHNLYWRPGGSPKVYFPISSTSSKVDPRFVNMSTGDLHLASGSPAIDTGGTAGVTAGFAVDLDGLKVPAGAAPDKGAYERGGTVTLAPAPTPTPTSSTTVHGSDAFSRTVSNGWGSATSGGAYRLIGDAADFDVNGSAGTASLRAGQTREATLPLVKPRDVSATARLRTDRLATGSGAYAYLVVRQSSDARNEYRLKIRISASRSIYVQVLRLVGGTEAAVGGEVATGLTHSAGSYIRVRFSASGANPTSLKARVWADGQGEPSTWNLQVSDASSSLQTAGAVALRGYNSSSATSTVLLTWDDWVLGAP